jgi:hypothetical protein
MPSAIDPQPDGRWIRRLFFALVLLYLVPVWTVHYLPTVDGPCHTYNAWIIRSYADVPLFQKYYEINTRPYPNWTGHAVMALLMFVVPPLVAEKLLVTLYVVLFLSGVWYFAGTVKAERRWLAFLAFPFVYNHMFQFGFYNFSIGMALFLWIVGFWWRRRERVDLRYAVAINLLLWVCYLTHIVAFVLALLAIAVLWLATLSREGWRRHLLHVAVLAPQIVLPIWYFAVKGSKYVVPERRPLATLARYLLELKVLAVGEAQQWSAIGLAIVFLVLVAATLWWGRFRRSGEVENPQPAFRQADAFLLLALAFVALYFFSPDGMGGGNLLKPRLSMFPYLILIPWLAPPLTRRARRLCVAGLALLALLNLGYMTALYQVMSGIMEKYLAGLAPVRPNTRVLPLLFRREAPVLGHAIGYAALEKNLIDWDNFEATGSHFPAIFRASAPPPPYEEIEYHPGELSVEEWKDRADYIYTWRMPRNHPLVGRLAEHYNLISVVDGGALWERRE